MSERERRKVRRLRRSRSDRMIGGVCAGIGDYLGIDPPVVRLAFVGLTLFAGAGAIVYVAAWIVVPLAPEPETEEAA